LLKSESVKKKNKAKKATVTITTIVVDHTSNREGQFTCFISMRTSWKKVPSLLKDSEAFPTGDIRENPLTRCSSSSRFNFAACAIPSTASLLQIQIVPPASLFRQ
jgi:hypothetical protein